MICEKCGSASKPLFTGFFCVAECDRKPAEVKSYGEFLFDVVDGEGYVWCVFKLNKAPEYDYIGWTELSLDYISPDYKGWFVGNPFPGVPSRPVGWGNGMLNMRFVPVAPILKEIYKEYLKL